MNTSEQINEIAAALAQAQGEMEGAVKDAANPFFKSKYADLASVRDATRVPFAKHGLAVVQFPKAEFAGTPEPYEWTAKSGEKRYGVRVVCIVSVLTRLVHKSGQFMEDVASTMLPTGDPQAVGSAITYLRRYAWQSVAGVAPEDDDGEAAHRGNGHQNARETAAQEAPAATAVKPPADPLTDADIEKVGTLAKRAGLQKHADLKPVLKKLAGVETLRALDRAFLPDLLKSLEQMGDAGIAKDVDEFLGAPANARA